MGTTVALEPIVELHPVVCLTNEEISELMGTTKDIRRGFGLCGWLDIGAV